MLKIGYTYGDLGGIGPEIFQKFYQSYASNLEKSSLQIKLIDEYIPIDDTKITMGKPNAYAGEHAAKVLEKASALIKNSEIDYLITGPVAKESLWLAGIEYSGQTELLANINGLSRDDIEMFFTLDDFRVVLATRHIALKQVPDELIRRLPRVLQNSSKALKNVFGINAAKIAIAGLNPHAGENGLIGTEEKEKIVPIIQEFLANNKDQVSITGPIAADYLLASAAQKYLKHEKLDYDLYITAYHDQALPLIKGIGAYRAINLTLGLPFIRLSVDHGTAYDIAGKGLASPAALEACTEYCFKLQQLQVKR